MLASRLQLHNPERYCSGWNNTLSLFDVEGVVTSSTLRGGSNDTIGFAVAVATLLPLVEKVLIHSSSLGATGSSILAGAGNDSIYFGNGDPTTTITSVRRR